MAAALLCAAGATASARPVVDSDVQTYEYHSGRGALGISVLSLTQPLRTYFGTGKDGVLVGSVEPDSPAARAGVQVGDIIVRVENNPIDSVGGIRSAMSGLHKGDQARIEVIRDHRALTLGATLDADVPNVNVGTQIDMNSQRGFDELEKWMQHVEQELRELRARPATPPPAAPAPMSQDRS